MPVVMEEIVLVRPLRSRALPQRIIQPLRYGHLFAMTDGFAMVGVPGARKEQAAELPGVQGIDSFDDPGPTSPLVAHLHDAFMLPRRCNHQLGFVWIVAAWFLDVHVLASR